MVSDQIGPEFVEEDEDEIDRAAVEQFSQAVLYSSDWTVETMISQLARGNIEMNPRFQRRDAWTSKGKSLFIESIILGLPIPQIVLAEKSNQRGQYIVLDGKQRLLSLLQFTGQATGPRNQFGLSGLEVRTDLRRLKYENLQLDPAKRDDLNAFLNHTIRTVVIRNWPNTDFLHIVFLRLNTGSVKLSPQELRQAMVPGDFSNYVDDVAAEMPELQTLLSRQSPDPRMRDVELLMRYLALRNFLDSYAGRMKAFLDSSCATLNAEWGVRREDVENQIRDFRESLVVLFNIFEEKNLARKPESYSFNRAIFDALMFYASDERIRNEMAGNPEAVQEAYQIAMSNEAFKTAIESDTAGIPHTLDRLKIWGETLKRALGIDFAIPGLREKRICFGGFWA